jgi:hypothetical protein
MNEGWRSVTVAVASGDHSAVVADDDVEVEPTFNVAQRAGAAHVPFEPLAELRGKLGDGVRKAA